MRILLVSIALLYLGAAQAQVRTIYLNMPGALDALERDNPAHYEKARAVLASAQERPQSALFLTTYPPKQNVQFWIDDVEYRATVTLTNWRVDRSRDPYRPSPRR